MYDHRRKNNIILTLNQVNRLLLNKKKGSLRLSGIRFCDFSYIIYLYTQTHTKTGLDSVALKVCKKMFTLLVFGVNMTPH